MSTRTFILAVTGCAVIVACGSYGTSVVEVGNTRTPVASVSVTVPAKLAAGQTARAVATPKDANGTALTGRPVLWYSSSGSIASVSDSGIISAVAPGTAVVSAVSEGVAGQASMAVVPPPPTPIATVVVAVNPSAVLIGQTAQASATLADSIGNPISGRVINWSSSNAGISTVSTSGLVTAIAAGSATITALSETKTGTAAITVSAPAPVPVASVSVSPATATVQVGGTVQFSAVTRDANNNVLTGRSITWSSSSIAVATVSASGLANAVAVGTAQITAISEGKSASAILTDTSLLPSPPPPSGTSNEPSGMTFIKQRSFGALQEDLSWDTDTTLSIVNDTAAPISPPSVIRATFPANFPAGNAPGHAGTTHVPYRSVYIRFAAKLSSNWVGNGSATSKYMYEWTQGPNPAFFFGAHGVGTAELVPYVYMQGIPVFPAGGGNQAPNLFPSARIIRGQWQVYEILLTGNSAGTADGIIDWWLDGIHVGHVTGIQWTTAATTFNIFEFSPVWGGINAVPAITQTQTMDWDHVYLSGKN